jgi:uncharacterized protein YegL
VQSRTRPVKTKAKNGGKPCEGTSESRPCNSGSCDVNCKLGKWSKFSKCSAPCNTGYRERFKEVVTPVKGMGACPAFHNKNRYQLQKCNKQKCTYDEQCFAQMDLVIALDGSGSLTRKGFEVMKTLAAKVVRRLKPVAYGRQAVQTAIVQFGNGKVMPDKTVSPATILAPFSSDMESIASTVEKAVWQKGFTNMAQAILKAGDVLKGSSRKGAESVLLLVTDGTPTFKYQTKAVVDSFKQFGRLAVVQVKAFPKKADIMRMKDYATTPWQMNYYRVPSKSALKSDPDQFVSKVVAKFCRQAESPKAKAVADSWAGFHLTKEGQFCGETGKASKADSVEACFNAAQQVKGWNSFSFGTGKCFVYSGPCASYTDNAQFNTYEPSEPPPPGATPPPTPMPGMR